MESSHRLTVVHGVEGGDLVDTHRRHLQQAGYLVHDAKACEAMLALAEIEKRHHGGFLVLRGIALEDFGHELLVDGIEFKRNLRVIVRGISVLEKNSKRQDLEFCEGRGGGRTTCRASLLMQALVERNRH